MIENLKLEAFVVKTSFKCEAYSKELNVSFYDKYNDFNNKNSHLKWALQVGIIRNRFQIDFAFVAHIFSGEFVCKMLHIFENNTGIWQHSFLDVLEYAFYMHVVD